jgi:hypothetical protein
MPDQTERPTPNRELTSEGEVAAIVAAFRVLINCLEEVM